MTCDVVGSSRSLLFFLFRLSFGLDYLGHFQWFTYMEQGVMSDDIRLVVSLFDRT
jgi:hypothetical protein